MNVVMTKNCLHVAVSLCQVYYGKMWWREKVLSATPNEKRLNKLLDELAILTKINVFPRKSLQKLTDTDAWYAKPFLEAVNLPTYGQFLRNKLKETGILPKSTDYLDMLESKLNGLYPETLAIELLIELDKIFDYAEY